MADYVAATARQAFGNDRFIPVARPSMGGEDFSYYLEKVPGCFFLVGVEPPGGERLPVAAQRPLRLHRRRAGGGDADVRRAGAELQAGGGMTRSGGDAHEIAVVAGVLDSGVLDSVG